MPMLANSCDRLDWCALPPPDSGILRFFLLLVFSKDSYPSAEEAVDAGAGGTFAAISFLWTLSTLEPSLTGDDQR